MEIFLEAEFWVAVAFVIALGIMWWKGSKTVASMLDARADQIRGDLSEAKRLREEAEQTLATYQRRQSEAMNEAAGIADRARAEAKRLAEQAMLELEETLKRREIQAHERIAQAEVAATAAVRAAAVDIAMSAAKQLIGQSLTSERGAKLIDESIQALPAKLN